MDSESACLQDVSRRNAELFASQAGCVGYEVGGAQYQAGLIRGFDPAVILKLGLPKNMAAHSLQRSQYVNGLSVIPSPTRVKLFEATSSIVGAHYGRTNPEDFKWSFNETNPVAWFPYNFHAGNYFTTTGTGEEYSPQNETTAEMLKAGIVPLPTWVFSPRFTLKQLEEWTNRQIDLW